MSISLNQAQLNSLNNLVNAGNYPAAYNHLAGIAENTPGADSRVANWLKAAANAKKLPEVSGSGRVRNLREAMSGASSLTTLVDTYAKQTTYTSQRAQLDRLVRAWAGTADQHPGGHGQGL